MDYMSFLVKNDSMTHKTINLCDMYYFQPPKLNKNTFKPLLKNLMLPNKTLKFHPFYFKTVYNGSKYVPKPPLYSHIKYFDLPDPFEW